MDTVVVVAALVAAMTILLLALRITNVSLETSRAIRRSQSSPDTPEKGEEVRTARAPILIPDYVDSELLSEIATQRGIDLTPVTIQLGSRSREQSQAQAALKAEVTAPGVAHVGASAGGGQLAETSNEASLAFERRQSFRAQMDQILEVLRDNGELHRGLDTVPESGVVEAMFMQAEVAIRFEWGLDDLDEAVPDDDPRRKYSDVLEEISDDAMRVIEIEKGKELKSLLSQSNPSFALVENLWLVQEFDGHLQLGLSRLKVPESLYSHSDIGDVPVAFPISVPLPEEHLTSRGRERLKQEAFVRASVFGKLERFDEDTGSLLLFPVAVFSA